jgi:hypothetical protein
MPQIGTNWHEACHKLARKAAKKIEEPTKKTTAAQKKPLYPKLTQKFPKTAQSGTKKTTTAQKKPQRHKVAQKKPNRHKKNHNGTKKTKPAQKKPNRHKAAQKKPKKPSWPKTAQTGTKWPQLGPKCLAECWTDDSVFG